jgi:hypothetical protein
MNEVASAIAAPAADSIRRRRVICVGRVSVSAGVRGSRSSVWDMEISVSEHRRAP